MNSSLDREVALIDRLLPGIERVTQAVGAHWAKIPEEPQTCFCMCHKPSNKAAGPPGAVGRNSKTTLYTSRSHGLVNKVASKHLTKAWNFFLLGAISVPIDQTTCQRNKIKDQHRNQREKKYLLQESHLVSSHSAQSMQIPGIGKSTHHAYIL